MKIEVGCFVRIGNGWRSEDDGLFCTGGMMKMYDGAGRDFEAVAVSHNPIGLFLT